MKNSEKCERLAAGVYRIGEYAIWKTRAYTGRTFKGKGGTRPGVSSYWAVRYVGKLDNEGVLLAGKPAPGRELESFDTKEEAVMWVRRGWADTMRKVTG